MWPPWRLPEAALSTQQLFRVAYRGPEGDGSFRLTLRLASRDHFLLAAADRLGRRLWTVAVDGEEVVWMDHREERYCRQGGLPLPLVGESPVEPRALPLLLLDGVPVAPEGPPAAPAERLELRDTAGRVWRVDLEGGRVVRWTVTGVAGRRWRWRREEPGAVLWEVGTEREVRWRRVVVEALAGGLEIEVPEGYREVCGRDGEGPV